MPTITVSGVAYGARLLTDTENDPHKSNAFVYREVGKAYQKYRDMAVKNGFEYFVSIGTVTTVAGQESYSLPTDFGDLISVEIEDSGTSTGYRSMYPFEHYERNEFNSGTAGTFPPLFHIEGDNILLQPIPNSVKTVRLHYVPTTTAPSALTGSDTLDTGGLFVLEQLIEAQVAKAILMREESPTGQISEEIKDLTKQLRSDITNRDGPHKIKNTRHLRRYSWTRKLW